MRVSAVIDACVLYSVWKRNILLSLADAGCFIPLWTQEILDETEKHLSEKLSPSESSKQILNITRVFDKSLIKIYDANPELGFDLPDECDRHVIGAAIASSASVIVTDNLRDFPNEKLKFLGLRALGADMFISEILASSVKKGMQAVRSMRLRFNNPPYNATELIDELKSSKINLNKTSAILERYEFLL